MPEEDSSDEVRAKAPLQTLVIKELREQTGHASLVMPYVEHFHQTTRTVTRQQILNGLWRSAELLKYEKESSRRTSFRFSDKGQAKKRHPAFFTATRAAEIVARRVGKTQALLPNMVT